MKRLDLDACKTRLRRAKSIGAKDEVRNRHKSACKSASSSFTPHSFPTNLPLPSANPTDQASCQRGLCSDSPFKYVHPLTSPAFRDLFSGGQCFGMRSLALLIEFVLLSVMLSAFTVFLCQIETVAEILLLDSFDVFTTMPFCSFFHSFHFY